MMLIINADNYGLRGGVTNAIAYCSFEVMTHPVCWEEGDFVKYVPFGKLYDYKTPIEHLKAVLDAHRDKFDLFTCADL